MKNKKLKTNNKPSFLNLRGIITLVVILAVVDLAVAFAAAPFLTGFVQGQVNKYSKVKVQIGSVRFHPVLLSFGVSNIEVYDSKNSERLFRADHAAFRLDPVALLEKRVGFSKVSLDRVELEAVKDASGKYNFEMGQAPEDKLALLKQMVTRENLDLYGKLYEKLKALMRMSSKMKKKSRQKISQDTKIYGGV